MLLWFLLTKSLSQSTDPRLSIIAFENIEKLKVETDILITKAVSWALRSLVKFHQLEVLDYLEKNKGLFTQDCLSRGFFPKPSPAASTTILKNK